MQPHSFSGGIHPPYRKEPASGLAIERAPIPSEVVIPLHQHTGAPCEPTVSKGDQVQVGQMIGNSEAFVSAPIHASVAGQVKSVEPRLHPLGGQVLSVVIETGDGDQDPEFPQVRSMEDTEPERIRTLVREAGVVGLGGAAFPTAVKLSPPPDQAVDTYLLNAAECEPYLSADHRLLVERPAEVVRGFRAMMKAAGVGRGIIVIEDNKPDAIEVMGFAAGEVGLEVAVVHTKYPQGSEKHLIRAVVGRVVPSGGLPFHVGCLVSNVGTAVAVIDAVERDRPLYERVVTVGGGAVARSVNLLCRIGTPFSVLVEAAGGLLSNPVKVVMGGPMMGVAQGDLSAPVVKATSGLLAFTAQELARIPTGPCIRCGRCVDACPMGLLPAFLGAHAERNNIDEAERLAAMDCVECGCCAYVCPAARPLVQAIRTAKAAIGARRRKG